MANIINITERGNRLEFTEAYSPIVCGNSNYYLHFSFSDVWAKCLKKTAVFVVDGKRAMVDFEGEDVKVPVMPNAPCVFVSLVSGMGYEQMATTSLKITLEPSASASKLSEVEHLAGYLPKVYGAVNSFINGETVVKKAEQANNVVNPNLLINGDFRVNQRDKEVYTGASAWQYTFDRWRIYNTGNVVNTVTKKITLATGTFEQVVEDYKSFIGKTLTLSVNIKSYSGTLSLILADGSDVTSTSKVISETGVVSVTRKIQNGATTLRCIIQNTGSGTAEFEIEWAKLEIGETPTEFAPRLYAEELALCKRYFQTIFSRQISGTTAASGGSLAYVTVNYEVEMRTLGTRIPKQALTIATQPTTGAGVSYTQSEAGLYFSYVTKKGGWYAFKNFTDLPKATSFLVQQEGVCLEIDAEIY